MGIYSIFYAKKFNSKVFAFEPSLRNLDLLTRNISLNNLNKKIIVFSNPLNKEDKISEFYQFDLKEEMLEQLLTLKILKEELERIRIIKKQRTHLFKLTALD